MKTVPGRSFAPQLRNRKSTWENQVFYEQEETRGIRTQQFAYWKRMQGTGDIELYDMQSDPGQAHNLAQNPDYRAAITKLDHQMTRFFDTYSDPKYDLWRGGIAKGSVIRTDMFRQLYGPQWSPRTELLEPYRE